MQGENLEVLRGLAAESFELIYVDPPFNTGRRQVRPRITTVRDPDGDRIGFGGVRYRTVKDDASLAGYLDRFDDYVGFLRPRMEEARRVLTATGSLFLHVDPREVHYCKVMLDEVFGRACFQNEIIWAYDYGARATKRWPAKHDNLLWYTRDAERYTFDLNETDRIPYMAPTLVGAEKGGARQDPDRCVVAHDRESDGQGEDWVRDAEAAGHAGADCAGSFAAGGTGAGLFCGLGDDGRGRGEARARLSDGGRERGGGSGDAEGDSGCWPSGDDVQSDSAYGVARILTRL